MKNKKFGAENAGDTHTHTRTHARTSHSTKRTKQTLSNRRCCNHACLKPCRTCIQRHDSHQDKGTVITTFDKEFPVSKGSKPVCARCRKVNTLRKRVSRKLDEDKISITRGRRVWSELKDPQMKDRILHQFGLLHNVTAHKRVFRKRLEGVADYLSWQGNLNDFFAVWTVYRRNLLSKNCPKLGAVKEKKITVEVSRKPTSNGSVPSIVYNPSLFLPKCNRIPTLGTQLLFPAHVLVHAAGISVLQYSSNVVL